MAKTKKREIGASIQLPLGFLVPETTWELPTELPDLRSLGPYLAIDTETKDDGLANGRGAGWVYRAGYIAGISMAAGDRKVYIPLRHPETQNFDHDQVRRWLADHYASSQRKFFHNAPYDCGWIMTEFDLPPPALLDDTMGMAFMLDENRLEYNLDAICRWQGVQGKDETMLRAAADAFGVDAKSELWRLPARFVGGYAEQDAVATLGIGAIMLQKLAQDDLMEAYQLEANLIPMCIEMRRRGIRISVERAQEGQRHLISLRDEALRELSDRAAIGRQWSIKDVNSSQFLSRIFDGFSVPYPKTAAGNDSFSNEWMEKSDHWLPQLCARAMKMHDAGEKFIGNYILGFSHMGRLHSEIHQFKDDRGGTVTTRFSYSSPPLQQMPARNPEIAKIIRGVFLPEPGEIWGALDYSQQEYRLMVHFAILCKMAGVDKAAQMYRDDPNTDFHEMVARLTGLPRRKAKDVNFAKAFGAGVAKFALMTGLTLDEAKAAMEQYDSEMPFISRLAEFCQKRADQRGYIRMIDGARGRFDRWEPRWTNYEDVRASQGRAIAEGRPMPKTAPCDLQEARARCEDPDHPWSGRLRRAMTHKAMNKLIQGSAARQTKLAMRQCWREGIVPLIQMHDELGFSFTEESTAIRAGEIMRDTVKLQVPCKVDLEFGVDWGDAKHSWDEVSAMLRGGQ